MACAQPCTRPPPVVGIEKLQLPGTRRAAVTPRTRIIDRVEAGCCDTPILDGLPSASQSANRVPLTAHSRGRPNRGRSRSDGAWRALGAQVSGCRVDAAGGGLIPADAAACSRQSGTRSWSIFLLLESSALVRPCPATKSRCKERLVGLHWMRAACLPACRRYMAPILPIYKPTQHGCINQRHHTLIASLALLLTAQDRVDGSVCDRRDGQVLLGALGAGDAADGGIGWIAAGVGGAACGGEVR